MDEVLGFLTRRFGADSARQIVAAWRSNFELTGVQLPDPLVPPERNAEFGDLLILMTEGGTTDPTIPVAAIARWIAYTCMGSDHLWSDLGLPARPELTRLMRDVFPALAARNDRNMRWKRFLYKQLCEREELFICRSPTCETCSDYTICFVVPGATDDVESAAPSAPGS